MLQKKERIVRFHDNAPEDASFTALPQRRPEKYRSRRKGKVRLRYQANGTDGLKRNGTEVQGIPVRSGVERKVCIAGILHSLRQRTDGYAHRQTGGQTVQQGRDIGMKKIGCSRDGNGRKGRDGKSRVESGVLPKNAIGMDTEALTVRSQGNGSLSPLEEYPSRFPLKFSDILADGRLGNTH